MPGALAKPGTRRRPAIGCGVDVVDLVRFRRVVRRGGEPFMRRVFTPEEVAYARARKRTMLLHLAGRFAAKEAVMKALSQLNGRPVPPMNRIEVRNDRIGRPRIILHGWRGRPPQIHISLSHVESVAVASAFILG